MRVGVRVRVGVSVLGDAGAALTRALPLTLTLRLTLTLIFPQEEARGGEDGLRDEGREGRWGSGAGL